MKRKFKTAGWLLLTVLFVAIVIYVSKAFPIITGYSAKVACSCMYNSNRSLSDVKQNELAGLPFSLASLKIDRDSSVVSSILGLASNKAIFRKGLGCTLVHDADENELRQLSLKRELPYQQDTIDWPMGNRNAYFVPENVDTELLSKAFKYAFSKADGKKVFGTRAVMVVYNGKIVREQFAAGFTPATRHTGWSMNKSIGNALVGILVKQGKLSVEEDHLFKEWETDNRKFLTVDNLLHANSGLKWREIYSMPSPATNMLFIKPDAAKYAASFPLENKPGTLFRYSSGTSNLLSAIIKRKTGNDYLNFPYQFLFRKTGMLSAILEPDASGTFISSSYGFASAHDWARFGLLYLNDGVAGGERILPEGWVTYTTTPKSSAKLGEYGAQFWLNAGEAGNINNRTYPSVPADCFYADGYEGQFVWIIPSKNLVVVKLALQNHDKMDENKFLSMVVKAIKPEKMLKKPAALSQKAKKANTGF